VINFNKKFGLYKVLFISNVQYWIIELQLIKTIFIYR